MRQLIPLWVVLLSCGLAMSQGDWTPLGNYAQPFVSRISTPSAAPGSIPPPFLSLESPSLTAGATNATAGNVAGAATSTLSIVSSGPGVQFNPEAYGSSPSQVQVQAGPSREGREFELGAATFQSNYAVAQLAAISGARGKARRVYTNSNIARVNDSNRSIQYAGKIEGVN